MFGYLRETSELALKSGNDKTTGICRTGLEEYLGVIFPDVKDWVHDKITGIVIEGRKSRKRPDYRSEELKLIIEYDGLPHYQNPDIVLKDIEDYTFYYRSGYKLVRIPYFIQLTNNVVSRLFGVKVSQELFPEDIPSLSIENRNTPAFLCFEGIRRVAKEFLMFPEQLRVNLDYLKSLENDYLTGVSLLEYFIK